MPSRKLGVDTGSALPLPFMDTVIDLATQIERRRNALDVPELAGLLKMSRQKIYNLIQKGEIPSYRIAGSIRLDPATTAIWLRSQAT
jgi:excisionase family DNA binding protein